LKADNRKIPNFPLTSIGAIFLEMMYNVSDFADFELRMIAEFEDSLTRPRNDLRIIDGNFNRINMSTDCTSFLINIQCERQGGGTYFDGLFDTNVTINISETPMYRGNNDSYFIPDLIDPTLHPPSPLICFVNETLIIWDKQNGKEYREELAEVKQIISHPRD
jgi:hypothetical protein